MTDFIPDPVKNFTPRQNVRRKPEPLPSESALTAGELAKLETMDANALLRLVQRMNAVLLGIALKDDEQVAEAMLLKLAHIALTSRDSKDTLAAIREWLDRVKGKAVQPISQAVKISYEPLIIRGLYDDKVIDND